MKNIILSTILLLSALNFLSGCTGIAVSSATTAGVLIAQERSVGKAIDDFSIWSKIKHSYVKNKIDTVASGINLDVIEGRVHLTGFVDKPETRIEAVRLAWQPEGVKEVINEIIIKKEDNITSSIKETAIDKWLKAQLSGKLLLEKNVKSINYSIEAVKGNIYIMGIAQNLSELKKVTDIASKIRGVNKVISHVKIKSDPDRG